MVEVAWDDPDAVTLRSLMDAELAQRYPQLDEPRSAELRGTLTVDPADVVTTVLVRDADGRAIGHAALRRHRGDLEVKRVVVAAKQRGLGVGRLLMARLEVAARDAGASRLILHTGNRQPEAVAMYEGLGYRPIPLYEPYATAMPSSFCFEKVL